MTEITVDIYENEAEYSDFHPGGAEITLRFSKPTEGFIHLDERAFPISGGRCAVSLRSHKDGEISLNLTLFDRIIKLPTLIKDGNSVSPASLDDDFIRRLSKRERAIEKQVQDLQATVEKLTKSVYGTTLFN